MRSLSIILLFLVIISCQNQKEYDLVIRNGAIYDGFGQKSFVGDLAIQSDTIVAMGNLSKAIGKKAFGLSGELSD